MDNIKFGKLILKLRKKQNMTQKELAEKLNVTDKAVSKWERGDSFPDITLLEPIAKELGVTVSELITGEKDLNDDEIKNKIEQFAKELKENRNKKIKKYIKIISIIILCVILILSMLFVAKDKLATFNISRAIIGYIKVVNFNASYYEVQNIPNRVMYANESSSLNDYMKQFGYEEDTEKQMGYNRVFTNGERSINIKCWGLLDGYPFQIWEFGNSDVIAKKDEVKEEKENSMDSGYIELEEIIGNNNLIANNIIE